MSVIRKNFFKSLVFLLNCDFLEIMDDVVSEECVFLEMLNVGFVEDVLFLRM